MSTDRVLNLTGVPLSSHLRWPGIKGIVVDEVSHPWDAFLRDIVYQHQPSRLPDEKIVELILLANSTAAPGNYHGHKYSGIIVRVDNDMVDALVHDMRRFNHYNGEDGKLTWCYDIWMPTVGSGGCIESIRKLWEKPRDHASQ